MAFMGFPCSCGWAFTELSETERFCECCGRHSIYKDGYWSVSAPQTDFTKKSVIQELGKTSLQDSDFRTMRKDFLNQRRAAVAAAKANDEKS